MDKLKSYLLNCFGLILSLSLKGRTKLEVSNERLIELANEYLFLNVEELGEKINKANALYFVKYIDDAVTLLSINMYCGNWRKQLEECAEFIDSDEEATSFKLHVAFENLIRVIGAWAIGFAVGFINAQEDDESH